MRVARVAVAVVVFVIAASETAGAQLYIYAPQTGGPGVNVRQQGARWQAFDPQTATTTSGRVNPGGGISGHASDGTFFWGSVRPNGSVTIYDGKGGMSQGHLR